MIPEPSIVTYRRSKNLREILVKSKQYPINRRTSQRSKNGFKKCLRSVCNMCSHTSPQNSHTTQSGDTYQIKRPITCETKNVIYRLGCRECNDFTYIGETKNQVYIRFGQHRSYIRKHDLTQPTGIHFERHGFNESALTVLPIEKVNPEGDHQLRKVRESLWISKYNATTQGSNRRQ